MEIVHDLAQLERYIGEAVQVSGRSPVLIDRYLSDAIEVDVDALCDGTDVFVAGVMEHIEEAGIHSGDSACALPPHSLEPSVIAELERQTAKLARALRVVGLMNVQFAIQDGHIYVLEVNPRASRTVPFVAKVIGRADRQAGRPDHGRRNDRRPSARASRQLRHVGVKEAVFPLQPLPGRRYAARPGDALDRRGHGPRSRLRGRLRQEPTGCRKQDAARRHRFRLGARRRQAEGAFRRTGAWPRSASG